MNKQEAIDSLECFRRNTAHILGDNDEKVKTIETCIMLVEEIEDETPNTSNTLNALDAISRQAAIDDLRDKDPSQIWDTADVEVWVNSLPSAQPEVIRCGDCLMHGACRFEIGLGENGFCSQGKRGDDDE